MSKYKPRKTLKNIAKLINQYYHTCVEKGVNGRHIIHQHPSYSGFSLFIGVTKKRLKEILEKEEFRPAKELLDTIIEEHNVQQLYRRDQVHGVIFVLKNQHGWSDTPDTEQGGSTLLSALQSIKEKKQSLAGKEQKKLPAQKKA